MVRYGRIRLNKFLLIIYMKVTINIPDEIYGGLVIDAENNTRTITQEVLHRVKSFGDSGSSVSSGKVPMQSHGDSLGHGSSLSSAKKVSPRVKKGSSRPKADTGKKGLPMQDVGGLKTYFKK